MFHKVFRRLTMVQLVCLFAAVVGMVVDSIVISRFLGETCYAAFGLSAPLLTLLSAIGGALSSGAQTMASNELGAGRVHKANICMVTGFVYGLLIAGALMVLLLLTAGPLAGLFAAGSADADPGLVDYTAQYIRGYCIGGPPLVVILIMMPFLQLDGDKNRIAVGAILMTIADIVLDLMNVFFFHGGMFGMGLASSVSTYLALVVLLLHFRKKNIMFCLHPGDCSGSSFLRILRTGSPYALGQICRTVLVITLNCLLNRAGGTPAVAAMSLVNTLYTVCCIPGSAICSSTLMLSSMMAGEKNRSGLLEVMKLFLRFSLILQAVLIVLVLVFVDPLTSFFLSGSTQTTIEMARLGARCMVISMFLASVTGSFRNFFQGVGRFAYTQLLCLLNTYVCLALPALILVPLLGTTGVWIAMLLADPLVCLVILLLSVLSNHRFPTGLGDLGCIPEKILVPAENLREYTLRSKEDAAACSAELNRFCLERKADRMTAIYMGLAVEEMVCYAVDHFEKESAESIFSVRAYRYGDHWTLRIRNDYPSFDPREYVGLVQEKEEDVLGLRMVVSMTNEIVYTYALNMNNLIMHF